MKYMDFVGSFWLGGGLTIFCDTSIFDWRWWVIIVPTIVFFTLKAQSKWDEGYKEGLETINLIKL